MRRPHASPRRFSPTSSRRWSKVNDLFQKKLHIVNFGIESFYEDLKSQKQEAIHVDWKPVAGGNKKMASLLGMLK